MRFDPKLIHPEEPPLDPQGELDLPADLAALAEQLRDDSAHLAERYPAVAALKATPSRPYGTYALLGSSVASLLVAIVIWQLQPGRPAAQPLTAVTAPVAEPTVEATIAVPAPTNSVSLADLSAPELEALLDMLDRDPNRVTSISF